VNIPAGDISTDAYLVYSQLTDRAERIKTVLEAKPQATIKDIAEVITDVPCAWTIPKRPRAGAGISRF